MAQQKIICTDNSGFEASLVLGKIYSVLKPQKGDTEYDVRIINEDDENYVYPLRCFKDKKNT